MNIRQGLFRLWVVFSALFLLVVSVASYDGIREEFKIANTDYDAMAREAGGYTLLPADCGIARGNSGSDYSLDKGLCWYKTEDFRRLYPEYKDIGDRFLAEKLYAEAGQPHQHIQPWKKVMEAAGIAFGLPLAVLVFGCSLLWALSGFRGPHSRDGGQRTAK